MDKRLVHNQPHPFCVVLALLDHILTWVFSNVCCRLLSLLPDLNSCCNGWAIGSHTDTHVEKKQSRHCGGEEGDILSSEDVKMVLQRLGISCDPDGEKLQYFLGYDQFSLLFEEDEPSLEEIREAFCFFDENRDEYIDAGELQRVLQRLGLREGSSNAACEQMIRAFDENGDGRMDFKEFVRFMEKGFC